ncbi:MAG: alpha/beta hydrolase [Myxococcota bacterium]
MRIVDTALVAIGLAYAFATPAPADELEPSQHAIEAHRDIDYMPGAEYPDARDRLDVFMPTQASGSPVIVFFHGGGLLIGDKSQGEFVAKALVPRGIGVVAANYRLSPAVTHPAHVQDAAAAFAWTIEHIADYGGDPKRVYLAGHSAGAYMAALLALDDSYLLEVGLSPTASRGMIAISPFLSVEEVAPDRPKSVWGSDPSTWRKASPSSYIGAGKPPLFFVYADGDDDWRRDQIEAAVRAFKAAGQASVEAVEVSDRSHLSIVEKLVEPDDPASLHIANFVLGSGNLGQ